MGPILTMKEKPQGLGAEISSDAFESQFKNNKKLFDADQVNLIINT